PPGDELALFRGASPLGQAPHEGFLALPCAEIRRLFRKGARAQWRAVAARAQALLRGPEPVPDYRGAALRLSETHEAFREENPRRHGAARSCGEAAAHRRLSEIEAAHSVQPVG